MAAPFIIPAAPLRRRFPAPLPPVLGARRKGRGARPWIATRAGRDLLDKRGRPRRFATKAAALRAAGRV